MTARNSGDIASFVSTSMRRDSASSSVRIRTCEAVENARSGQLRQQSNPSVYSSSEKNLKDAVLLPILLRQAVAMLDGIELLLTSGATHAANLQMRALFEASVYIDWILLGDSERKAEYYYVHNLRRKRVWARRTQSGSPESQEFIAMMNKSGVPIDDKLREASKNELQEIDRILSQPKFAVDRKSTRLNSSHTV